MITKAITNCLQNAAIKGWAKTYWAFDIHGTMLYPTFQSGVLSTKFYPHVKEVMQLLSKRSDIVLILYTCSYPHEIVEYLKYFEGHGIHFEYVNENPDVCAGAYGHYDRKFYFNILFEDKAGFDPLTDWKLVYDLLLAQKLQPKNTDHT
ncbi:hypothetical protein KK083_08805 [Fulvivirgaceae bacterium PWU4]|uniref:Uncharacterized protein n=1 Tax=Chryseosolibacter histidini TaxID=2782349 RepID=A0AAP2GNJ9_9BACT|nr:hypothetical protein [Chryseosolibacter histidini]MBT1696970.1 hypothetical protein [Chryseosolibacter histidini]